MKHIRPFNEFDNHKDEKIEEGLKDWIIAGAIALASSGSAKSQSSLQSPQSKEYSIKSDSVLKLDFSNEFRSGVYKTDEKSTDSIKQKLSEIAEFIKNNPSKDISIKINSGESQVPNVDIETGKRLPKGSLADKRANNVEGLIDDFMKSLSEKSGSKIGYNIDTTKVIGDTKYTQGIDDKHDAKYTEEQFVKVTVMATKESKSQSEDNKFSAYSELGERVFLDGGHAIGDVFYKSSVTTSRSSAGGLNTAYQDLILKTISSDLDVSHGKLYDGKMYLIPWEWWNKNKGSTTNHISQETLNYIKSHFQVK